VWPAALLFLVLTILLAYPLTAHPAGRLLAAGPDPDLFMWTLAWDVHAFTEQPLAIFDANIYYPERHTLAYSENLLGSAVVAAPVLWLTDNPVLALNIVALFSCVLCGLGAYVLARRIGVGPAGALLAGIVFAFSPPRFFRLSQLHLTTIQWMPFSLAFFHAYLDGGRPLHLRVAAACFTLQAVSSGHGAVFLTVAMVGLMVYRAAFGQPVAGLRWARDLGLAGVAALAPVFLIVFPYRTVQLEMGFRRSLENWSVTWSSFLASPSRLHMFLLSLAPQAHINDTAGAYLFPGYLPIVLAAAAILRIGSKSGDQSEVRRPSMTLFYGLLTLVGLWLSVGPPIGLWPLVYWLPGVNFIRVPSRFTLLAMLGLAMLAGLGFDRLAAGVAPKKRIWIATLLGGLLVAEFAAIPLTTVPYRIEIPEIDRWLDRQPKPFAIAEVPLASPRNLGAWERRQTAYMLHSTAHWQKTVHGYSGFRPPGHVELYSQLTTFPDETSLRSLNTLGVRYVVVHSDLYPPGQWPAVEDRIKGFDNWLRLEHVEGAGQVYSIIPGRDR
jgi:hypothetical protein